MGLIFNDLGDAHGQGHRLTLVHQDDGTVLLLSLNPDTGERQRIVLLEDQWQQLNCTLLKVHGKEKCRFWRPNNMCAASAVANR
jgi:hypothetical protein